MASLSARAIAVQGLGFTPRLIAVQGLWPFSDEAPDTSSFGARAARRRRDVALDARLDELDRELRRHEERRRRAGRREPGAADLEASPLLTFRDDEEAARRVASAIATLQVGGDLSAGDELALRTILSAARQRVADTEARRRRNRWRIILLVALVLLS